MLPSYLPSELWLLVASCLESERDINSLAQTNQQLYFLLNPYLYRHNSLFSRSSALFWAATQGSEATARTCLSNGPDVKEIDNLGMTPLSRAALNGREVVAKLLLETGRVDPDLQGRDGYTPLSLAACKGQQTMVKLLLDTGRVNVTSRGYRDYTPLDLAARFGREGTVRAVGVARHYHGRPIMTTRR